MSGGAIAASLQLMDVIAELQALLATQQEAFNVSAAGCVMDVLFEKSGRKPGQAVGRSPYLQAVHVDGAGALIGQIRAVRIAEVQPNSLKGEWLADAASVREAAE